MSSVINRVLLVGNLTRDPELRHTGGGTPVAEFGIAVNGREKDESGEWGDRPDFFDVKVWGNQAEACDEYLLKGSQVAVDGHLRQERWAKDGENRSKVIIVAQAVQFLARTAGSPETGSHDAQEAFQAPSPDDDIPF